VCDHACVLARGQLTAHRYVGLAGSVALAWSAFQVGARPGRADADGLPSLAQTPAVLIFVAGLVTLTAAWWRIGVVTTRPGGASLTGRWMLVTAALWALPLLVAPPLASRDVYAYACQGAVLAAGLDPTAVTPDALPCPWLDSAPLVWRDAPSPYGPLFTLLSAAAAAVSGGNVAVAVGVLRLVALAGVLLATGYGRRLARACGVNTARAAWLGLAGPTVAMHAIAGAHNDALLTGLAGAALAVAIARRGIVAGVLLGLAAAVKITALVALPFAVLLLVPAPRAWRRLLRPGAIVVATTALTYAALAVPTGLGLGNLRGLVRAGELVQWTSIPTAMGMSVGYALRAVGFDAGHDSGTGYDAAVAVARVAGLAAAIVAVVAVWLMAWRSPSDRIRLAVAGTGVAFAVVALFGPVFYPWYALTPLALLAVSTVDEKVRVRLAAASAVLAFLILPDGTGLAAGTKLVGALAVTTAVVAVAVRCALRRSRTAHRNPPTRSTATGL